MPLEFLKTLAAQSVIIAYDNDSDGDLMAQKVMRQLPNSVRRSPGAKDWNEELKNTFNLELHRQSKLKQQQHKSEQNQGEGLSL